MAVVVFMIKIGICAMLNLTEDQIKAICPTARKIDLYLPYLNIYLSRYAVNTPDRASMFLAQVLHESGGFKFVKEIWGDTSWQVKYEGHKGLGNTQPGDGKKYMGRGLVQCTGRSNYTEFAKWANLPEIVDQPELLEQPELAVLSAVWFWDKNKLNSYADKQDIEGCTKRVNGPKMLGLEERKHYYSKGKEVLMGILLDTDID
jgi:putative chitinase